jgi:hypothetical protein
MRRICFGEMMLADPGEKQAHLVGEYRLVDGLTNKLVRRARVSRSPLPLSVK